MLNFYKDFGGNSHSDVLNINKGGKNISYLLVKMLFPA